LLALVIYAKVFLSKSSEKSSFMDIFYSTISSELTNSHVNLAALLLALVIRARNSEKSAFKLFRIVYLVGS